MLGCNRNKRNHQIALCSITEGTARRRPDDTGKPRGKASYVTEKPGFEEIPLDLSTTPTVEDGLAIAAVRYRRFIDVAKSAFGDGPDRLLFREHLSLMSFVNRASSLHMGVLCAVRESNPHSAFTLLRAYLELVVTVLYADRHPEYIEALERPMAELPRRTRKRFAELFEFAARELRGIRAVYASLNEMAHFGSTALWYPFSIEDDGDTARLSFYTGPRWRKEEDARIALAMLRESDEAMLEVLQRYAAHHVQPLVERYLERDRIRRSFAVAGAGASDDERAVGTLSPELGSAAVEAGLLAWCEEHDAFELAEGVTADQIEAWAAGRPERRA
ncbi:MAG: hypothetical protein ACOYXS_04560 [Chloroflexota bacterium]